MTTDTKKREDEVREEDDENSDENLFTHDQTNGIIELHVQLDHDPVNRDWIRRHRSSNKAA